MHAIDTHPGADELSAFTLGRLDGDSLASIEAHLAECPACQARAAASPDDSLVGLLQSVHAGSARQGETVAEAAAEAVTVPPSGAGLTGGTLALPDPGPETLPAGESPSGLDRHERYRLVRLLGKGGMGAVYEAEHRVMQRPVALKVISPHYVSNAAAVDRFRREARAAAKLSHPNIVHAYDAENAGETHFLVTEYIAGTTLGRLVKEGGPLPPELACEYTRQAAMGLQHAHECGMVHRDVKPDNLILTDDGVVKVLDFGLASLNAERGEDGLTEQNAVMGTPEYMAPEQAEDSHSADTRADVYSLGCTLFYLLTGSVPYPATTSMLKILAHRERPVPAIPGLPDGLMPVLRKLMAKRPEDRYQTPGEAAAALARFTRPPVKKSRAGLWIAVAGLLAVAALAGVVVHRIQTDNGELVITVVDDDVEVLVKQGGKLVRIVDTKTERTILLRSGVYELELKGGEGLKLDIDKATLKRGDKKVATIERVKKEKPPEAVVVPTPKADGLLHRIKWGDGERFANIEISPDGRYFLAGRTHVGTVRLWDMKSGKQLHEFAGYVGRFLPGNQVVTGSWDGGTLFRIYDLPGGKLRGMIEGPNPLYNFTVSPDGSRLLSISPNRIHVWDVAKRRELFNLPWDPAQTPLLVFSLDSKLLLYQPLRKLPLKALDASTGKEAAVPPELRDLARLEGPVMGGPSADGRRFIYSEGLHLLVFDAGSGKRIAKLEGDGGGGAVSGDGRRWLTRRAGSNEFRVLDIDSGEQMHAFRLPKDLDTTKFLNLALSGDGKHVVIAGHPDWLHVYRLPDPPAKPKD